MKNTYIIAEAGVNHNGKLSIALELIEIAKNCGADAIKFQTFSSKKLLLENTLKAKYQINNTGNDESQYEMLKNLELSYDDHIKIKKHCDNLNIEFLSTPFDIDSVDFLNKLGVNKFKIGSGDLTNFQLLKKIALTKKSIILSTGMSNLQEVENAINYIKKYTISNITVLHCVSNYPTSYNETNLLCIKTMKKKFNLPIGFSDHTLDHQSAIISISLGATCIEKHFTLDKNLHGPDHKSSLNPYELKKYIHKIRKTEIMLGNGIKICQPSEINTKNLIRRSIVINKNMKKFDIITENDIIALRPDNGISANEWENIIGRKLNKNLDKYSMLNWSDLESY